MTKALLLIGDDLRINDNPALLNAMQNNDEILVIYIYNQDYAGRPLGAASKVFLHHSLVSFCKLLKDSYNIDLLITKGNISDVLQDVCNNYQFDEFYFNESYVKTYNDTLFDAKKFLSDKFKIQCNHFKAQTLFSYGSIKNGSGEDFKVFTPFWKACLKNIDKIGATLLATHGNFARQAKVEIKSLNIKDLGLLPTNQGNWHKEIAAHWTFDYKVIENNIDDFINHKTKDYANNRNLTYIDGCSRLSPYFRFGLVSPRYVFNKVLASDSTSDQFLAELGWREFAYHVAFVNPNLYQQELKTHFANFKWEEKGENLKAWQDGQTGFEIVDAGMKELYATGQMHNRVRMITASFLIKDLLIDWKLGEQYFWNTLVDACPVVNPFSWQWVFGSGYDASPYFRIFNPDTQRERFDPDFKYCKKWLGEKYFDNLNMRIVNHSIQRDKAQRLYSLIQQ